MNNTKIFYTAILIVSILSTVKSQEIKEWRGLNRDGIFHEKNLLNEWPDTGPELLWSFDSLPVGYSSLCIVENTIYLTGTQDTMDVCIALEINGKIKWETVYGRAWNGSYPDTRCTPAYNNGKLYVSSGYGDVACIDAISGDLLWQVKGYEKWDIKFCTWGVAESLIVFKDKVIFNPVGENTTTVALDKETGEVIWESKSIQDSTAYVSPILVKYAGINMMINIASANLYGVNLANGDIIWTFKYYNINTPTWSSRAPINNCTSPLFYKNQIFVTSGYNHTGALIELNEDATEAKLVWADTLLDNHHGGVVRIGDYIYGSNWINNSKGNWICLDWKTGEKKWDEKWQTKGSIVSADNKLILYDEKRGFVGLAEATPENFNLISSFKVPLGKGPHWSHPVICNGVLYIRHNKALLAYNITNSQ